MKIRVVLVITTKEENSLGDNAMWIERRMVGYQDYGLPRYNSARVVRIEEIEDREIPVEGSDNT